MIIDLFHNKIVKETMTDAFRDSVNDVLVPLLVGKYADSLERITMYEDYIADNFLFEGEWYYPLTVKLHDSEAFTSWIKWPITKKTFNNSIPYAYVGDGKLAFDFAGFVPGGFADKLQGRRIDYDQNAISFNIEALAADPLLLVGKYSQTFVDELASQITDVLSRALGVSGIAQSTMELQFVFAPNTYLEHTSENVTYRRLLLVDKGCQARDFWIKWTRLDGAVGYRVSDHVASDAIKFDLGEDVAQKIREKEYRFLAGANPDKYQAAMGKRTVTEWRDIIKRAIKRGDLVKVVSETELAQHASDISDKLRAILGQAAPISEPETKAENDSFDLVAALAKSALEKEEAIVAEESAEVIEELPEIEIEEYVEEPEEVIAELVEETVEESTETEDEIVEETSEELVEEPAEELADAPAEELIEAIADESAAEVEEEIADDIEEEAEAVIEEEIAEEAIEIPALEIETPSSDNSFEFDFGGFSDGAMFETVEETSTPEPEKEDVVPTPSLFVDEEALRREIEAKVRLEYETEARLKAEREAEQLRLEHERLIEENERLARIAKEAEEKRIAEEEAKKAEEEARRLAEEERQRELEAKKAEEERIRAEIEEKLRLEAKERERVAEAARMAVEEQKRLEAERAEKALREREEALAREAERLRREEEERRAIEERRLEEQRRREEEERRRLEEEEARRQVVIVSKRAKLLFRYAVDVNVIKRIKEVVEETLVSSGKEKLNIHIKAYPQDSNSIALEIKIPQNEMDLLVSMMKALGGASMGITKIILE